MKKCPKCGTILDDVKKKCYMCGADIQVKNRLDFMSGFDDQIGAAVTKGQDNVFNAVPDISVKINDVVNDKANKNVAVSSESSSAEFFKNEMKSLNSMQYDERTAIEKIFSNDSRFRSKDEINAEEAMKKNSKKKGSDGGFFSADVNNKNVEKQNNNVNVEVKSNSVEENPFEAINKEKNDVVGNNVSQQQIPQTFDNVVPSNEVVNQNIPTNIQQVVQQPVQKVKPKKEKKNKVEKAPINWGNNLQQNSMNNFSFLQKIKSMNISPSFIFNTVCFVLFATALIVMFFKFRDDKTDKGIVNIGDLNYKVSSKLKLKDESSFIKQYTYGEGCVFRLSFGQVSDPNEYIDKYLDDINEDYSSDNGYLTQLNEMKINGNTWSEISVLQLKDNPAATGGYSPSAKYRFVTMVYNNKYYEIRYVNEDSDNSCSAMYDDLITSLEFVD